MVLPIPNSPLAEDATAFVLSGLKGWVEDSLTDVAPKTSRAIQEDGSMKIFVKILRPRVVEDESAHVEKADKVCSSAAEDLETEADDDDWVTSVEPTSPKKKTASKKNGKKKKKAQDSGGELVGSSSSAPLAVDE